MNYTSELLSNAALILVLCFAQRLIRARAREPVGSVLSGVLFGAAGVLAMSQALVFIDGLFFDARTVVLSIGALFGGPIVAAVSAAISAAYRLYLGGDGAWIGVATIAVASIGGLLARQLFGSAPHTLGARWFAALGMAVHAIAFLLFGFLPISFIDLLERLAAPYLGVLPLATVAMGLLLREIESIQMFDRMLTESRDRLQDLFDSTATALLEEDYSGVYRSLRRLRESGVTDLKQHLAHHPDLVDEIAQQVKVIKTNPAAVRLFGVSTEAELKARIDTFFGPGARETFIDELCAIWDGANWFQQETMLRTADGSELVAIIAVPIHDDERSGRVPVSILDITELRQSEGETLKERARLKEILWGTGVGTWVWNVQTGEFAINDRWADIVGYTLEELAPISIETWKRLAHPDDLRRSNAVLDQVFARKLDFYSCEMRIRHKEGRWVWVLDRGNVAEWSPDGAAVRLSGTHMDITDRKLAERKASHLQSVRQTLLECHADILAADSESDLYVRTSKTLAEERAYALVWIGMPDDGPDKAVRPVARSGPQSSYVDDLVVHWSDDDLGQGPTGRAIRSGEIQIARDLEKDPSFSPWLANAEGHGLLASASVPIKVEGAVVATLNIYSSSSDAFDDDEVDLIQEFANNISLAISSLRAEAERLRLNAELEEAALGAVSAIATTIEKRDPYTAGHQESVARLSVAIARRLGWSRLKIQGLRLGALIHDIGKIAVPSEILNRPGKLSEPEFIIIKSHPTVGYEILEKTQFPWPIQDMVVQHHERLDGSGYPKGLQSDQIIDEARVIAVADVVDAIISHRPYRPGLGVDAALAEIERGKGSIYDPKVVDACLTLFRKDGFQITKS